MPDIVTPSFAFSSCACNILHHRRDSTRPPCYTVLACNMQVAEVMLCSMGKCFDMCTNEQVSRHQLTADPSATKLLRCILWNAMIAAVFDMLDDP